MIASWRLPRASMSRRWLIISLWRKGGERFLLLSPMVRPHNLSAYADMESSEDDSSSLPSAVS